MLLSLILFVIVYGIVFSMGIYYISRLIEYGPKGAAAETPDGVPSGHSPPPDGRARSHRGDLSHGRHLLLAAARLAGVIGIAVALYVVLDGFDLGIGILFPFTPEEERRDVMMNSVAPFWDGNETWLVLGGAGLFVAFPLAYAIIMPAVYLPLIIMLLALVFRGVAFEFRWVAKPSHEFWDIAFAYGSIVAAFMQGVMLGGYLQGINVENGHFAGGPFDWLTPFALFTGFALIVGYALLGATWLVMKTEGELAVNARRWAQYLLLVVLVSWSS